MCGKKETENWVYVAFTERAESGLWLSRAFASQVMKTNTQHNFVRKWKEDSLLQLSLSVEPPF